MFKLTLQLVARYVNWLIAASLIDETVDVVDDLNNITASSSSSSSSLTSSNSNSNLSLSSSSSSNVSQEDNNSSNNVSKTTEDIATNENTSSSSSTAASRGTLNEFQQVQSLVTKERIREKKCFFNDKDFVLYRLMLKKFQHYLNHNLLVRKLIVVLRIFFLYWFFRL